MEYAGIAVIPLVVGLAEIFKRAGLPAKLIPIIDLVLGLAAGIIFISPSDLKAGVIQGIYIGLSAAGLFSGVKNIAQTKTTQQ